MAYQHSLIHWFVLVTNTVKHAYNELLETIKLKQDIHIQ